MIKKLIKKIYNWEVIVDIVVINVGIYYIYTNQLKVELLIRSLILMSLILIYWMLCSKLGMLFVSKNFSPAFEEKYVRNRNSFIAFTLELKNYKIFKKDWIKDIFYLSRYCLPWMWPFFVIRRIIIIGLYIRVWINGNKDIIMKRWGIDSTEWFAVVHKTWFYWLWKFVVIYPIWRIVLYPEYIKSNILKKMWHEILRVRILGYFYIIILTSNGYSELLKYFYNNKILLMMIVYVYFALLVPIILYIKKDERYLYPKIRIYGYASYLYSLTLNTYFYFIALSFDYYFSHKYGIYISQKKHLSLFIGGSVNTRPYFVKDGNKWLKNNEHFDANVYQEEYNKFISNEGIWLFEKNYGFSALSMIEIDRYCNASHMIIQDQIWEEGKARYGVEYMWKEYGQYYLEILEFYKCYLCVKFEYERLGVGIEGWKDKVPSKIMGLKMYKDTLKMSNFFYGVFNFSRWIRKNEGIWVHEFGYSNIVQYFDEITENDIKWYNENLEEYKKEKEGKFVFLIEKMEMDTPFFLTNGFDEGFIIPDPSRYQVKEGKKQILIKLETYDYHQKRFLEFKKHIKLKAYDFKNNSITEYEKKVKTEYDEEVKKLKNWYSVEIALNEINYYKKKYEFRRKRDSYYTSVIPLTYY